MFRHAFIIYFRRRYFSSSLAAAEAYIFDAAILAFAAFAMLLDIFISASLAMLFILRILMPLIFHFFSPLRHY
jgi:hypothetical protein